MSWKRSRAVAVAVVLTAAGTGTAAAQDHSLTLQAAGVTNPFTSAEDIEAGRRVFRTSCALCHGGDASGGLGPDLTRGQFRHGSSDDALFRNVLTGIPGSDMPGVYRPDTEIWQVVSYVRSLSEGAEPVELPGDVVRGSRLFRSRGSCSDCHRVEGRGGRLGPDLSDIGWSRSPQHIEAALLRPAEFIPPRYRTVRVFAKDGSVASGVLRYEDTYSIQILDENESLRSFMTADLEHIEKPEESLMPPFATFFSEREIQDLVAYLYSLRGEVSRSGQAGGPAIPE